MVRANLLMVFLACLLVPGPASADVLVSWDWNDGTTQGWTASTSQSNVGNAFQATNVGNGSLQMFGPVILPLDLTGLTTISFDLMITSFSTVSSPSELALARLNFNPLVPGPGVAWNLDLSNLSFGAWRTFNLSIADAARPELLANGAFFSLIFTREFEPNVSSGRLDNFVVSGSMIPEPSTMFLVGPILVFLWFSIYRKHRVS
jgi:hypothetical protein